MGTDFYIRTPKCKECGRFDVFHLGKRSAGWKFLFAKDNVKSVAEAVVLTASNGFEIIDEYGKQYSCREFWDIVLELQKLKDHPDVEIIDGYNFLSGTFS